jgi:calcineurin-like phosphoesterase family protein/type IX secretion system substrate protein
MKNFVLIFLVLNFSILLFGDPLFFPEGSEWKYLDDGSNQGTAWREIGFDDTEWSTGLAQFGFGDGDETTVVNSGHICYYFRKVVEVEDVSELEEVYFDIVHDDGMVLYINGVEIVRSPLMPQTGEITYLTGTTTFIPTANENNFWTYPVDTSYFVEGENTIAISVHNQNTSSSDISFDCRVTESVTYKLDGPYVFYRNDEIIVKTIEEDGPQTYTYTDPNSVELICRFSSGTDSFNVELRPELIIEESTFPLPQKFLATSDIEGNLDAFIMLLIDSEVIDENYNWIFGEGHLFIVGDLFDRGEKVTECLWLVYKLESEAEAQGGKIHFVIGNHDMMNLIYDFRYVNAKYLDNVVLIEETLESIYATDTELGRWLRTKNIIEKVDPLIFVHGGISPAVAALMLPFETMNYWGRYQMDDECPTYEGQTINGGSDTGLYWYRGMAYEELTQQVVDDIMFIFESEKVIIGHTVFNEITFLYNNKVIAIDLDHEDNYQDGFMEALYFEDGDFFNFYTNGNEVTYTYLNGITGVSEDNIIENTELELLSYPNPFNPETTISFVIPSDSNVELTIYDLRGRKVKSLLNKYLENGEYLQPWNGKNDYNQLVSSGIYFCHLKVNNKVQEVNKIVLLK